MRLISAAADGEELAAGGQERSARDVGDRAGEERDVALGVERARLQIEDGLVVEGGDAVGIGNGERAAVDGEVDGAVVRSAADGEPGGPELSAAGDGDVGRSVVRADAQAVERGDGVESMLTTAPPDAPRPQSLRPPAL